MKFQRNAVDLYLTDVSHVQDNSASGKKGEMVEYCKQHVVVCCTVNSGVFLVCFSWKRPPKTPIHVLHHLVIYQLLKVRGCLAQRQGVTAHC